jgi:hypothetical protein
MKPVMAIELSPAFPFCASFSLTVWTQGLTLARKALCHSTSPDCSPSCFLCALMPGVEVFPVHRSLFAPVSDTLRVEPGSRSSSRPDAAQAESKSQVEGGAGRVGSRSKFKPRPGPVLQSRAQHALHPLVSPQTS